MQTCDVIIIGAGAAGLAAGRILSNQGLSVVLLEARGRLGGRIHTIHDPAFPQPVELGAEFIHGEEPALFRTLDAAKLIRYELADNHLLYRDGTLHPLDDDFSGDLQRVMSRLEQPMPAEWTFRDFLEQRCTEPELAESRELATAFVEGFDAAPIDRISAQSLADEAGGGAMGTQFRIIGGYGGLVEHLAAGLHPDHAEVRLSTVVRRIRWRRDAVEVLATTSWGTPLPPFRARRAIITLPAGVLNSAEDHPAHVAFEPELPAKRDAARHVQMGPVIKAMLLFREPFWEGHRPANGAESLKDLVFIHSNHAHFPTWWTYLPLRMPMLTAWAGGPAASRLSGRPASEVASLALDTLCEMIAFDRAKAESLLQACHIADWQADPFALGAYSYVTPGHANPRSALAETVEETLFFAGEATHGKQSGTVAAALATGRRAAEEIARHSNAANR